MIRSLLFLLVASSVYATDWSEVQANISDKGIKQTATILVIDTTTQSADLFVHGELENTYKVSTSKAKPSCVPDSHATPLGFHKIDEIIGANAPINTVFTNRSQTSYTYQESAETKPLVTSRVLMLRGLEQSVNVGTDADGRSVDTRSRLIYLHGTNKESLLGKPRSGGCIRFSNEDIVNLSSSLPVGSIVWIK
jgi:hypothetical protein